ncbi:hypothetical protein EDI_194830 [Entamoeba dispar SAW760]|uniref:Uncharacterized protein n=1 Tax=Entamoeba dispar (strain ATCC PRA-260 / SAW760) TaxID=370354 RepID=B0EET1_ENTDS|nr:uncharacterized protein EDI_194830 [Entamoeba dispar SAW760]EDR26964.1 hypothetical protein EDI_194830 [Entamoeba dispar SAW760]|eukprot:EDR26964.1 hypothetical protein EDI_194830 [Entamoeba dispar SAW760]
MIQLKLPPIQLPTTIITNTIKHTPFQIRQISVKTIEENKREELMKEYYIIYQEIDEIERYNNNGYIEYDKYKEITIQLLHSLNTLKENRFAVGIDNRMKDFINDLTLAKKRVEKGVPNCCSKINLVKSLLKTPKQWNDLMEFQKFLFKLLHVTSDFNFQGIQSIYDKINFLISLQKIPPIDTINQIEQELLNLIQKNSI